MTNYLDNTLAVCIPTHNRSELISDTLNFELLALKSLGYDIYIFDSSTDDLTEKAILNFKKNGYNNLYLIKVNSNVTLREKVFSIFKNNSLYKNYKYIWLTNDVFGISNELLNIIQPHLNSDYSLIAINNKDKEKIGIKKYDNPNEFFKDFAWRSTLFGAIITSSEFLKSVDFYEVETNYKNEFFHLGLYFDTIIKIKDFRAIHINADNKVYYSPIKKESFWKKYTLKIWCEDFQDAINQINVDYSNKKETIQKLGIYSGLFTLKGFIILRLENLFNIMLLKKYKEEIIKLSGLSIFELYLIASTPRFIIKLYFALKDFSRKLKF